MTRPAMAASPTAWTLWLKYFRQLVTRYAAEPADNLISALIRAREQDDALSDAELIATCTLMLFGGHKTTANFIANGVLALLRHPDQMALIGADQVEMKAVLDEFMRYHGPAKTVVRVAREDFEFHGQQIRAGQRVFLILSVANRDPLACAEPDKLRLDRGVVRHLGFGLGSHFCLGSPLAKLAAGIAMPAIVKHLAKLELAPAPLKWLPFLATRGLRELRLLTG